MLHATGSFNSSGNPTIKISAWGVFKDAAVEVEAMVDTGFSGFLSMPIVQAFPLGLTLIGSTTVVLADGSTRVRLMALGFVAIHCEEGPNVENMGVILLEPEAAEPLLGMAFLRAFDCKLFVAKDTVKIIDDAALQVMAERTEKAKSAKGTKPALTTSEPAPPPAPPASA